MNTKMISTRGKDSASIDEAILQGLAKDGGLYVPEHFPQYRVDAFYQYEQLSDFATRLLAPFFQGSAISINDNFCREVFHFPMPLHPLEDKRYVLELFHGPTLSFKDFGARFFGHCLQHLTTNNPTTVLVATSGDTGSAVAGALHLLDGIEGVILFPKDKISLRQQAQITGWGDNIHAIAVNGTFDQCQYLVKKSFEQGFAHKKLTTANSINIARLLPQVLFYAYSSIQMMKIHKQAANFIVPSGNLGNVTACYWAKTLGFPIGEILIANNANKVLEDFLASGVYEARPSIKTLANAMDVGDPSNLERLRYLLGSFAEFKEKVNVRSVSDQEITAAISACYERYNYMICPHTATAFHRFNETTKDKPWIIVGTAHPAKFNDIIEPLLHCSIPVPESLQQLLSREQQFEVIEPEMWALERALGALL